MSKNRAQRTRTAAQRSQRNVIIAIVAIAISMLVCVSAVGGTAFWSFSRFLRGDATPSAVGAPTWSTDSAELTIAVSPIMAPVLTDLAAQFNGQRQATPDGATMSVRILAYQPDKMVQEALGEPAFQALSPDSTLWLDRLEAQWAAQEGQNAADTSENAMPIGERRISNQVRYAVSPVVIVAWESVARELGWPANAVGWETIQRKATADANFKWSHPSTSNASGLLATPAEFYAGAGLTRGLTEEAATADATLAYVRAVEGTVRFYGEGEEVIVQRLASEGRDFLDAFVAQEQVVIAWNQSHSGERLVALYPAEGALWTDHPLALLELGSRTTERAVTDNQRLTYQAFAAFLSSPEMQQALLANGYRPADLSIALDSPGSPFATSDNSVDRRQPQTTLQMPPPAVIEIVTNAWYLTKRPTNVFLVVDTSGSMEGDKIIRTKEALQAFVEQIKGDRDQLGLIEFGSGVKTFLPLRTLDDSAGRETLAAIDNMEAVGGTALIDAVYNAIVDLQTQGDAERINAIVVMTDGQENESYYWLNDLQDLMRRQAEPPLVIFTIAFGRDADEGMLRDIATLGNGQFRRADETDIEELYKIISTYF